MMSFLITIIIKTKKKLNKITYEMGTIIKWTKSKSYRYWKEQ